jgi:hypothetical protein
LLTELELSGRIRGGSDGYAMSDDFRR